jgi:putative ABC transport system permease protein
MRMYLSLAWRNIWRNKKRTAITIASIVFALMIALFARSMQLGSFSKMIDNMVSFYTGYAQIHSAGFWERQTIDRSFGYSDSLASLAEGVRNVTVVAPRLESFALVSSGEQTSGALIVGISPTSEDLITGLGSRVIEGRYLEPGDEHLLLAEGLAARLGVSVGDTLVLLGQGYHGITAAGKHPIAGVVRFPSPDLNTRVGYLTLEEAQFLYGTDNRVTAMVVMVEDQKYLSDVMADLQADYDDSYEVMSWDEMLPELVQLIETKLAGGMVMLFIIYMVISFGILGTVLMMAHERTREFGMLIAIGLQRAKLSLVLFLESVILSILGVIVGSGLGAALVLYMHRNPIVLSGRMAEMMLNYGFEPIMPCAFDVTIFVNQASVVLAIAVIVSVYPVLRALRLAPVEAMRS